MTRKERIIAYIDGYNLYFGLIESDFRRYLWLNIEALVTNLLKPNQELIQVIFFTTLVTNDVNKRQRQKAYIASLQSLDKVKVVFGKFQKEDSKCRVCGNSYQTEAEKMTDVSIATTLICDFYEDKFDTALLISGDTDLIPPIKIINESSTNKRVMVAFPPKRVNDEVRKFAKGDFVIGRKTLADSQLPEVITNKNGETFRKPSEWV